MRAAALSILAALLLQACGGLPPRTIGPDIPPEQLPPPGMCRLWYPDRQLIDQPPPADCALLSRNIPPNARLIQGARRDKSSQSYQRELDRSRRY